MPIYTYICKDCGEKFDLLMRSMHRAEKPNCNKCGSKNTEKTFAPFGISGSFDKKSTNSSSSNYPTGVCSPGGCPPGGCPAGL